uniref:Uncharacterized protein n=1 Tax=Glossina austeni TaxID=7395 RepID=A0A1A9UT41_GLOAU
MKIEEKHCFLEIDFNVFHCKVIGGWSASVFKRPHPEMMTLVPSGTSALAKAIGFILSVKVKGDCNFNRATSLKGLLYSSWTMSFSTCVTTPPSKRLMDPACIEKGLVSILSEFSFTKLMSRAEPSVNPITVIRNPTRNIGKLGTAGTERKTGDAD